MPKYSLIDNILKRFVKKHVYYILYPFPTKIAFYLPKIMTALRIAQLEKYPFSSFFVYTSLHNRPASPPSPPPGQTLTKHTHTHTHTPFKSFKHIMQTCPCNIQQFLETVKMIIFR